MKFKGKKYLFANLYDKLIIRKDYSDNSIECITNPNNKMDMFLDDNYCNFSEEYNNLDNDLDRIYSIVRYFLRNANLYSIKDNSHFGKYKGKGILISGDARKLFLSVGKLNYNCKLYNLILDKYIFDFFNNVYRIIKENDVNVISFYNSDRESLYTYWKQKSYLSMTGIRYYNSLDIYYTGLLPDYIKRFIIDLVNDSSIIRENICNVFELDDVAINLLNLNKADKSELATIINQIKCDKIKDSDVDKKQLSLWKEN